VVPLATSLALVTGALGATHAAALSDGVPTTDAAHGFVARVSVGDRLCTGALVTPEWVVTAMSCLAADGGSVTAGRPPSPTRVTVGRPDLATSTGRVVDVGWLLPRDDRDLVLARLTTPVTDVTPAVVATRPVTTGTLLQVAGFGRTGTEWAPEQLRTATFAVTDSADGRLTLSGHHPAEATACRGDAGGPVFHAVRARAELVALTSSGWQGGCLAETETRTGVTATRLDDIADWIATHTPPSPASALSPARDGTLLRDSSNGLIAVIAGGAKFPFASPEELEGTGYTWDYTDVTHDIMVGITTVPRAGTLLRDPADGAVYVTVGIFRVHLVSWAEVAATGYGDAPYTNVPSRILRTYPETPPDRTLLRNPVDGSSHVVAGGALVRFGGPGEMRRSGYEPVATDVPTRFLESLPTVPRDGALLRDHVSGAVSVMAGGAPLAAADPGALSGTGPGAPVDVPTRFLESLPTVPRDGTLLRATDAVQVWRITGGRRVPVADPAGAPVAVVPPSALAGIPG
jgi:hypothetical protein